MKIFRTWVFLFLVAAPSMAQVPVISSVAPVSGRPESSAIVIGSGFSAVPSENHVFIGPMPASVTAGNTTSLTFRVPRGVWSAPLTVRTPQGQAVSREWFRPTVACSRALDSAAFTISRVLPSIGYNPAVALFSDIDGDMISDLLVINRNSSSLTIFRTVPFGETITDYFFSTDADLSTGYIPTDLKTVDMDNDGKWDILTTHHFSPTVSIWRNTSSIGNIVMSPPLDFATQEGFKRLAIADFDNDGKPDAAVASRDTGLVEVLRNTSSPGAIALSHAVLGVRFAGVTSIAAADLDGDGRRDLVIASETQGSIAAMRNTSGTGGISFSPLQTVLLLPSPADFEIADMNGDGIPDIVAVSATDSVMVVYSNVSTVGTISFSLSCSVPTPSAPSRIAIADINADASLDAAVVTTGGIAALYKNTGEAGSILQQGFVWSFGGSSYGVAVGDLTGDNKADLAVCGFTDGLIHLFQNTLPEATDVTLRAGWNLVSLPRRPSSLVATDLFPSASSYLFGYTGASYVFRDTLQPGDGYWVLYASATVNTIAGSEITEAYVDVPLGNRWFLIGSLTARLPLTSLSSEPPDAFSNSSVFGLGGGGGYVVPEYLEPGIGYWVYVYQPCRIWLR